MRKLKAQNIIAGEIPCLIIFPTSLMIETVVPRHCDKTAILVTDERVREGLRPAIASVYFRQRLTVYFIVPIAYLARFYCRY